MISAGLGLKTKGKRREREKEGRKVSKEDDAMNDKQRIEEKDL